MFAELMADSVVRPVLQIDAFPPHEPVFVSSLTHTTQGPLFILCCANELFFMALYLMHFNIGSEGMTIATGGAST